MNYVGLETEGSFRNNAAYIAGWLKALKDDKKLVLVAVNKDMKRTPDETDEERRPIN